MANNAISYIANVGKSILYSTADQITATSPAIKSFMDENADLGKTLYKSISDYKKTAKDMKNKIKDSEGYDIASKYKQSLMEDIRSGKFYNRERKDKVDSFIGGFDNFGDGFEELDNGDFDFDDTSFGEEDSWEPDAGDEYLADTFDAVGEKSSRAISEVMARSSEYIVQGQRESTRAINAQSRFLAGELNVGLGAINSNLASILNLTSESLKIHIDNSSKFYEVSNKLDEERNDILKQMLEIQKKSSGMTEEKSSSSKKITYEDMVTSDGGVRIADYLKNIQQNIKESTGGILDMFSSTEHNLMYQFTASPLQFLTDAIAKKIVPNIIKDSMAELDKSISGAFGTLMMKFNEMAEGDNPLFSMIGKVLGVDNSLKTTLDTSKYNKGPMQYNGIAQKSITEVIPGYLSQMVGLLGGETKVYDFASGKFRKVSSIKKDHDSITTNNARFATYDAQEELLQMVQNSVKMNQEELSSFRDTMEKMFEESYKKGKMINPFESEFDTTMNWDAINDSNMGNVKLMKAAMRNMKGSTLLQSNANIMSTRQSQTNRMKSMEAEGSVNNVLFSDLFDIGKDGNSKLKGGILGNTTDGKGHDVFWYLGNIYRELTELNNSSGTPGPRRRGKKGGTYKRPTLDEFIKDESGNLGYNDGESTRRFNAAYVEDSKKNRYMVNKQEAEMMDDKELDGKMSWVKDEMGRLDKRNTGKKSFVEKIAESRNLSDNTKAIYNNAAEMANKPVTFIGAIMQKADRRLFEVLYGKKDEKNQKSFVGDLMYRMGTMFNKFNSWLNDSILTPLKERFSPENVKGFFKKIFAHFGIDIDEKINKVKDKINSTELVQNTKQRFKDAYNWTKGAVKDAYKPVTDRVFGVKKFADVKKRDMWMANQQLNSVEGTNGLTPESFYANNAANYSNQANALGDIRNRMIAAGKKTTYIDKRLEKLSGKANSSELNLRQLRQSRDFIESNKSTHTEQLMKLLKLQESNWDDPNTALGKKLGSKRLSSVLDRTYANIGKDKKNIANIGIEDIYNTLLNSKDKRDIRLGKMVEGLKSGGKSGMSLGYLLKLMENGKLPGFATGTNYVEDTGIYTLSEGEAVITPENNPFGKGRERKSKKKSTLNSRQSDEAAAARHGKIGNVKKFAKNRASENKYDDYVINPLYMEVGDELVNGFSAVVNRVKEAAGIGMSKAKGLGKETAADDNAFNKVVADTMKNIHSYAPSMIVGGTIGTGVSLLTGALGGPLLGAAAGAAVGLLHDSETFRNVLFGDMIDGERSGGVFNKKLANAIEKYAPDMSKFGIAGGLTALLPFIPGGPITGLLIGSGIGFAKNNEKVQDALFGDGKIFNKDRMDKFKKLLPKMGAGAVAGAFLGPFGLAGNLIMGSAIGYATDSEKFKEQIFGKVGEDGKREGGLLGKVGGWIREDIINPVAEALKPIGKQVEIMAKGLVDGIKDPIIKFFDDNVSAPFGKALEQKIIGPATSFITKFLTFALRPTKFALSAPSKLIGAVGTHFKKKQVARGNATYMTAAERNEFRENQKGGLFGIGKGKIKKDKFADTDQLLAGMSEEDLTDITESLGFLQNSKESIKNQRNKTFNEVKNKIYGTSGMDVDTGKMIMTAFKKGDLDKQRALLLHRTKGRVSEDDINTLLNNLKDKSPEYSAIANVEKNSEKAKSKVFEKLREQGFNINGNKDIKKFQDLVNVETKARAKTDVEIQTEEQEKHHVEIVGLFKDLIENMEAINDPEAKEKWLAKRKKKAAAALGKKKGVASWLDYGSRIDENGQIAGSLSPDGPHKFLLTGEQKLNQASAFFAGLPGKFGKSISNKKAGLLAKWDELKSGKKKDDSENKDESKSRKTRTVATLFGTKKQIINKQGEQVDDMSDTETKNAVEDQKTFISSQKGLLERVTEIGSGFKGFVNGFFAKKDDGEDNIFVKALKKVGITAATVLGVSTGIGFLPKIYDWWTAGTTEKDDGFQGTVRDWATEHIAPHFKFMEDFWYMQFIPKVAAPLADEIVSIKSNIVNFINAMPTMTENLITTVSDFMTNAETGLPHLLTEHVIPFYTEGFDFVVEKIVGPVIEATIPQLPKILKAIWNGTENLFSTTVFGGTGDNTSDYSNTFQLGGQFANSSIPGTSSGAGGDLSNWVSKASNSVSSAFTYNATTGTSALGDSLRATSAEYAANKGTIADATALSATTTSTSTTNSGLLSKISTVATNTKNKLFGTSDTSGQSAALTAYESIGTDVNKAVKDKESAEIYYTDKYGNECIIGTSGAMYINGSLLPVHPSYIDTGVIVTAESESGKTVYSTVNSASSVNAVSKVNNYIQSNTSTISATAAIPQGALSKIMGTGTTSYTLPQESGTSTYGNVLGSGTVSQTLVVDGKTITATDPNYYFFRSTITTADGKKITMADIVNQNMYLGTMTDTYGDITGNVGSTVDIYGKDILTNPAVAEAVGYVVPADAQNNTNILNAETRKHLKSSSSDKKATLGSIAIRGGIKGFIRGQHSGGLLNGVSKGLNAASKVIKHVPIVGGLASLGMKAGSGLVGLASKGMNAVGDLGAKVGVSKVIDNVTGYTKVSKKASAAILNSGVASAVANKADDKTAKAFIKAGVNANKTARAVAAEADDGIMQKIANSKIGKSTIKKVSAKLDGGTGAIGKIGEAISNGVSKFFKNGKLINFIASKTGKKVSEEAMEKASKTLCKKLISWITKKGASLIAKFTLKIGAAVSTGGLFTVGSAIVAAYNGFRNANSILGVTKQPSIPIRLACSVASALNEVFLFGLIPLDIIFDLICDVLEPILGFGGALDVLKKNRNDAEKEVAAYNKENGTNYTIEEYNKKDRITTKIANGAKKVGKSVVGGAKKLGSSILGGAKNLLGLGDDGDEDENKKSTLSKIANSKLGKAAKVAALLNPVGQAVAGVGLAKKAIESIKKDGIKGTVSKVTNKVANSKVGKFASGAFGKVKGFFGLGEDDDKKGSTLSKVTNSKAGAVAKVASLLNPVGAAMAGVKTASNVIKSVSENGIKKTASNIAKKGKSIFKNILKGNLKGVFKDISDPLSSKKDDDDVIAKSEKAVSASTNLTMTIPAMMNNSLSNVFKSFKSMTSSKLKDTKTDDDKYIAKLKEGKASLSDLKFTQTASSNPLEAMNNLQSYIYRLSHASATMITRTINSVGTTSTATSDLSTSASAQAYYNSATHNSAGGSGVSDNGAFVSQVDKNGSMKYGSSNIEKSGCGPAAAAMILNSTKGENISIKDTAEYALQKGYVTSTGSTTADYFKDILSKNNIGTKYNDLSNGYGNVLTDLKNGRNVILMGQDASNTSKTKSPYGPGAHYVVATGASKDGKYIYVNDPESTKANRKYNAEKVLGSSKLGITTIAGDGSKGKNRYSRRFGNISGKGGSVDDVRRQNLGSYSELTATEIDNWIRSKNASSPFIGKGQVFVDAAAKTGLDPRYIVAHAAVESGWGTSRISQDKNNYFGIGAFDASAYASAYSFGSGLAAGIGGGAAWIRKNYYDRGQISLYKMRWNNGSHQYATDPQWDTKIASIMATAPENTKVSYDDSIHGELNGEAVTTSTSTSSTGDSIYGDLIGAFESLGGQMVVDPYGDNSSSSSTSTVSTSGNVTGVASSLKGKVKYSFGTDNIPGGTGDCSSFTKYVYNKALGTDIGRTTLAQVTKGTEVDRSNIQPGDLVFFKGTSSHNGSGNVSHVGISLGGNKFVHLSSGQDNVVESDLSSSYYNSHFATARRIEGASGSMLNLSRYAAAGSGLSESLQGASKKIKGLFDRKQKNVDLSKMTSISARGSSLPTMTMADDMAAPISVLKSNPELNQYKDGDYKEMLNSIITLLTNIQNSNANLDKMKQVVSILGDIVKQMATKQSTPATAASGTYTTSAKKSSKKTTTTSVDIQPALISTILNSTSSSATDDDALSNLLASLNELTSI